MAQLVAARYRTEALTWRWIFGAATLVLLVAFMLPLLSVARRSVYRPPTGLIASCAPPAVCVGPDGWVVPEKLSLAVHATLTRLFADIEPETSSPLTSWEDTTLSGIKYTAWGGKFMTLSMPLPKSIADLIPNGPQVEPGLLPDSLIALEVRYWTVRHDGVEPPGRVYFAIDMRTVPHTEGLDPSVKAAIADALVVSLAKEAIP